MKAYRNYPEGYVPSSGPFVVKQDDGFRYLSVVEANGATIQITTDVARVTPCNSRQARELAAALLECADFIDRAAMTPADVAEETRARR